MGRGVDRRQFLAYFSGLGLGSTLLPGILWSRIAGAQSEEVTKELVLEAQRLAGLDLTDEECEQMVRGLNGNVRSYRQIREVNVSNDVAPAIEFNPLPAGRSVAPGPVRATPPDHKGLTRPSNDDELAFLTVSQLAHLIKSGQITSEELTRIYLDRLKKYDADLQCVVSLTEELALRQARQADREIAAGRYRGPLHGIPWGAKDLLAAKGYRTTWGAKPYEDQVIDTDATVVERLTEAGAVLVAKLTLGALAMGDVWYGGRTNNPWNVERGSSGSSAGPAAATAAGLVGFAIGTETLGSIVSPCTACGVTGLRPTYGRVSRYGAMALSWSMDKIGPICRSVDDCALVFAAVTGPDGRDTTLVDAPFEWNSSAPPSNLRVGYVESSFSDSYRTRQNGQEVLDTFQRIGIDLIPIELPDSYPTSALRIILNAEAAAAFDELTLSNRDDLLVRQVSGAWPNAFRQARFIPAVEYIQANRVRRLIMEEMATVFDKVDVYLTSPFGGGNLLTTNLTGHPSVVLPNGFSENGMPTSVTLTGNLFREDQVLAVAKAYQDATDHHLKRPPLNG